MALTLRKRILGKSVQFELPDDAVFAYRLLLPNYVGFPEPKARDTGPDGRPDICIRVGKAEGRLVARDARWLGRHPGTQPPQHWVVSSPRTQSRHVETHADRLRWMEKALILELQLASPNLMFVHAGVVERDGNAVMIVGRPGAGKTTFTHTLINRGWRFVSDELAPIDPVSGKIWPYPRAFWFKQPPRATAGEKSFALGGDFYRLLPRASSRVDADQPLSCNAVVLLERDDNKACHLLTPAASATRMMPHLLNNEAHSNWGLGEVARFCSKRPCFVMGRSEPTRMSDQLDELVVSRDLAAVG